MSIAARPKSQSEEAYLVLRSQILACRIAPDEKILINEICERFEFSSGSVREALSRLTAEGLVVAEPQKGFRASPISVEDLKDLTRARAQVEALCLSEAIDHGDLGWEGRVLAAHHKLSRTRMMSDGEPPELQEQWSLAHADFHQALAEGCCSRWMLRIRSMLYEQSERYRRLSVPMDEAGRDVSAEHKAICDAAVSRDKEAALRLIQEHIEKTTAIILHSVAAKLPSLSGG